MSGSLPGSSSSLPFSYGSWSLPCSPRLANLAMALSDISSFAAVSGSLPKRCCRTFSQGASIDAGGSTSWACSMVTCGDGVGAAKVSGRLISRATGEGTGSPRSFAGSPGWAGEGDAMGSAGLACSGSRIEEVSVTGAAGETDRSAAGVGETEGPGACLATKG